MKRCADFLFQFHNIYFAKNFYQMFLVFSNYYKSYNINFITTFSTNKFIVSTALYSLQLQLCKESYSITTAKGFRVPAPGLNRNSDHLIISAFTLTCLLSFY
jgi:hypothetical protein